MVASLASSFLPDRLNHTYPPRDVQVFSMSGDPEIGPMAAGVSVHPALQIVGMMEEGSPESLADAATAPQLLLPAGNDPEVRTLCKPRVTAAYNACIRLTPRTRTFSQGGSCEEF